MASHSHAETIRGKFPNIPARSGPLVYVVQFSNGAIKVGFTSSARARVFSITTRARKLFGAVTVSDIHITAPQKTAEAARMGERATLNRLRGISEPVPGTTEFFAGIDFAQAVAIAEDAIAFAARHCRKRASVKPTTEARA